MPFDLHKNFAYSVVAVAPSPAVSGTTLTVAIGEGTRFPAAPFNATVWAAGAIPLLTNAEVVRVTAITAENTFTIVRAQEGSGARAITVGDQIAATITTKVLTDIEDLASTAVSAVQPLTALLQAHSVLSQRFSTLAGGAVGLVLKKNSGVDFDWSWQTDLQGGGGGASGTVTSQHLSTMSQQVSVLSQQVSVLSQQVSVLSQAHSVVSNALSNEISNRVSAANALSNAISIVSQQVSVLSQAHSVLSQQVSNEISNRISADNALSNAISIISQQVSALSQAHSVLSDSVSNLRSAHDSLSNVVSDSLSIGNAISQQVSVLSQQVSILSQAHSVLSQSVSVMSQLFSTLRGGALGQVLKKSAAADFNWSWQTDLTGGGGSATVTSNNLSVLSQAHSALSQQVSVLSTALSNDISVRNTLFVFGCQNVDAVAVSAGAPVYLFTSATTFKRADADAGGAAADVVGLVFDASIAVSAVGIIQYHGKLTLTTAQWDSITGQVGGLTVGSKYYVGTTAGTLTTTAPAPGNVRLVGIAYSTTDLVLKISDMDDVTSTLNLLSQGLSVLSQQVSVHSQQLSVLSQQVSILSQTTSVHSQLFSTLRGGITGQVLKKSANADFNWSWQADVTGGAASATITSNEISILSQGISVVSNALSNEISNRTSAVNVVSNAVSILSQQVSVLSQQVSVHSQQLSVLSQQVSVLSQGISVVSNALSNEISNRTSAVNVVSQAVSVLSQQVSILSQAVSVHSQLFSTLAGGAAGTFLKKSAAGDYLWTWASTPTGGAASATVTSQELSVLSQGISVETAARISVDNVISNQVSVVQQNVSVLSQQVSVLSQQVSVITAALSNLTSAHNALSNVVSNAQSAGDVISNQLSILSQQVSVISAGIGLAQMRVLANATTVSATAFTNVSGMSLSVTSAATYRIEGRLLHTVSTVNTVALGFTFPTGITPGALAMDGQISTEAGGELGFASGFIDHGYLNDTGMSTVATAILSVIYGASATTYMTNVYGLVRIGATAGTIQLQAKNSAAATSITFKQGSYLQAFRIQ